MKKKPELDMSPDACAARTRLQAQVEALKAKQGTNKEAQAKRTAHLNPLQGITPSLLQELTSLNSIPSLERNEEIDRERRKEIRERAQLTDEQERQAIWKKRCPARYLEPFDLRKVAPEVDRNEVQRVLSWQFQEKGLHILGGTGHSKSRAVYTLLARLYIEDKKRPVFMDGIKFANDAAAAWRDVERTEEWLKTLTDPPVLFLDDLGKRWTPSTVEAAFAVLDRRSIALKPTITTLNYSGDDLRGMTVNKDEVIEPFLRRVRDYCETIVF